MSQIIDMTDENKKRRLIIDGSMETSEVRSLMKTDPEFVVDALGRYYVGKGVGPPPSGGDVLMEIYAESRNTMSVQPPPERSRPDARKRPVAGKTKRRSPVNPTETPAKIKPTKKKKVSVTEMSLDHYFTETDEDSLVHV